MRVAISAIALLACTSLASAADLGGPYEFGGSIKDGPVIAAQPSWSGLYFGGHVGYGWGEFDGHPCAPGACQPQVWEDFSVDPDVDGVIGGLQAGWNHQVGSMVWGIEADVSWGDLNGSDEIFTNGQSVSWRDKFSVDAFGSVRGRLGVLVTNNLLIYGTGGLAWAMTDLKHEVWDNPINNPGQTVRASADESHIGWVAGAGAELMLAPNWTVRGEWLHFDFGEANYQAVGQSWDGVGFNNPYRADSISDVDLTLDVFRLGVNYKFGN